MSSTGTEIAKPLKFMNPGSLDENRGPYPSTAAANLAIPNTVKGGRNLREGKIVDIGIVPTLVPYWWNGGYADKNLVEYFGELATKVDFAPIKSTVEQTTVPSKQLSDNLNVFESGGWSPVSGAGFDSSNQIRTKNIAVPPTLIGQSITVSGFGSLGAAGGARVVVRDMDGATLLIIPGAGNILSPISYIMPARAAQVRYGVANEDGIGLHPTLNKYVDLFMVNVGATALPVEKFGPKIDHGKLDYPVAEIDGRISARVDDITLESVNVVNYMTDFESGGYAVSNGNKVATVNQLRTVMKPVLAEWRGKEMTLSGFGVLNPTGGARVVIRDNQNVALLIIPGAGTDYTPVTFPIPGTAASIGFGVANVLRIGEKPTDNVFTKTLQLQLGNQSSEFDEFGKSYINLVKGKNWPLDLGGFDESEIVVDKPSANFMTIYFHTGRSAANDLWFGVDFVRSVKPVTPESATSNYDTWKLNMGHIFKRVSENRFSILQQVILDGVWENAIYLNSGYRNALGSLHGNELMEEVTFIFDGIEKPSSFEGFIKCREVILTQRSNFTRQDSTNDFVGRSMKKWAIKNGVITISNKIKWFANLSIMQASYLSMCSVIRKNANNFQVTHTALRDEDYKKYDVSNESFENPLNSIKNDPEHKNVIIWGDRFGVDFRIIERSANRPDAGLWIQNSGLYNKVYGPAGSENVIPNRVWNTVFSVTPFVK